MKVRIDSLIYQDFIHNWIRNHKKKNPDKLSENKIDSFYEEFDLYSGLKFLKRNYSNKYSPEDTFEIIDKKKYFFFKLKNNLDSPEFHDMFEEIYEN